MSTSSRRGLSPKGQKLWKTGPSLVLAAIVLFSVGVCVVAGAIAWSLRPERLRPLITEAIHAHLGLDATVDSLALTWLPRPRLHGAGLTLRVPNQPDLPPFVTVNRFTIDVGLLSAIRKHVSAVHLDGLAIVVPPAGSRDGLRRRDVPGDGNDDRHGDGRGGADDTRSSAARDVIIDRLDARNTTLTLLRREPEKAPLVFNIHELEMEALGFARKIPFRTTLTNPVPQGLVESTGSVGPWTDAGPSELPVAGDYTFTLANLGTIRGIGGTLTSRGHYHGPITAITVRGETTTPDFNLDLGGQPLPLTTSFIAHVDGSDGSTRLELVDARLFNTRIRVTGAITNVSGPGQDIQLAAEIRDGRIEDVLRLAIDAAQPMLVGDVTIRTTIALEPGEGHVRDRLRLDGRFGLGGARFTDGDIQRRLDELSRRGQGRPRDEDVNRVLTDLRGQFQLADARLALRGVNFSVPGAAINLDGTYRLPDGGLDFRGTLRLRATVSQAVGGFKSLFIKPFDFIFRKDNAGAVIPISITGTREQPEMKAHLFGRR
jgi:hypothetical protein